MEAEGRKRNLINKGACKWCNTEFTFRRKSKEFCGSKCRSQYHIHKSNGAVVPYSDRTQELDQVKNPVLKSNGHVSGLKGIIEDRNKPRINTSQSKQHLKAEKKIHQLREKIAQREAELNQFPNTTISGGVVIGGIMGVLLTNKKKDFWAYSLNLGIGFVAGGIGQAIHNEVAKKRSERISESITVLKKQLKDTLMRLALIEFATDVEEVTSETIFLESPILDETIVDAVSTPVERERSSKLITTKELINRNFKSLNFKGKWNRLIGTPSVTFHMVIHGIPGQGKSTFSLQLSDYLAESFGKVVYISSEEGHSKTMKDKCILNNTNNPNLVIGDIRSYDELLSEIIPDEFHFIVIDSLNDLRIDIQQLKELKEIYKNSALITISQSTKNGQIRGSQQIVHDCDIEIRVNKGIATAQKNRFGAIGYEFEIF